MKILSVHRGTEVHKRYGEFHGIPGDGSDILGGGPRSGRSTTEATGFGGGAPRVLAA